MKKIRIIIILAFFNLPLQHSQVKAQGVHTADSTRSIVHMVLFKFSEKTTKVQIDQLLTQISSLTKTIPGTINVSYGENFSERSRGFTHAVIIKFTNLSSLNNFYKHPDHELLIKNHIKLILADMIVIDYQD